MNFAVPTDCLTSIMYDLFGGVFATALANATKTVCSAAPVFKVFCKNLTIYLHSSFAASYSNLHMIPSFAAVEPSP